MPRPSQAALSRRQAGRVLVGAWLASQVSCAARPPLRIGWLAEAHGADVNFGEDARNGVVLAMEQRNAAGGIGGRRLELVMQTFTPGQAPAALRALGAAGVQVLVGPFGTQLALALLPVADAAGMVMLSPTVTSDALVGRDDALLRLNLSNRESAQATARMLHAAGLQRIALAQDLRNADYVVPWSDSLRTAFGQLGGSVTTIVTFGTDPELSFDAVVQRLLAHEPDALVFVASGADAARMAQQARKRRSDIVLAAAGWAATPALIELGGRSVEGMLVSQAHNPQDSSPRFREFRQAFLARFGMAPGYGAAAAYDAMLVLTDALARTRTGETIKQALLRHGPYQGLQQTIVFDRFGDAGRTGYATVVRGGRFELLP